MSLPVFAIDNPDCKVPHHPIRWQAAYCMAKAETDDLEAVNGSPCMGEKVPDTLKTDCEKNAYWKHRWCLTVKEYRKGSSVETCVENPKMLPRGVVEGFGG